jgi:hypothetical protein
MKEYEKLVFTDPSKEEEWKNLPDTTKSFIMSNISHMASKLENSLAIDMLCHVINELIERVNKLEDEQLTQNPKKGCVMCGGPTELCQMCGAKNR